MEQVKSNTKVAGVDVGMEATGGYERPLRSALQDAELETVLHQPIEVKLFARLTRRRAKSDALDAHLIAAATARIDTVKAASDPRLVELADRLTAYEQIADQAAELKTFMEHVTLEDVAANLRAQIASLTRLKAKFLAEILRRIRAMPDIRARFELLLSLPGVGPVVAATLTVRMPELGSMKRGQAAALIGVAPFDHDSGQHRGVRFIAGGRTRPRRMLYMAAIAAKRCDPSLKALAQRLLDNGKPPKPLSPSCESSSKPPTSSFSDNHRGYGNRLEHGCSPFGLLCESAESRPDPDLKDDWACWGRGWLRFWSVSGVIWPVRRRRASRLS